ncbi:MAG TPA: glycosyltransferase, partial [Acidimicrobiales bacterium]|nr:glycosyltransferase [Acidimicrobiales bacterium]
VAQLLPDAHLARMPAGTGFAQAANQALDMVEGVAHVLVCHDDVALDHDAVRRLVEEAYRSNAGLTCPKFVLWDAPDRLLSVGLGADHLGVVHPLVEPGELDQGQHDAVREVFVAPTGAVLVRTDLWHALGGFVAGAVGPGGDLDLSWRAQLAGARVVVAPQARARHFEAGPKGFCHSYGTASPPARARATNISERLRLRTLWTCYSALFLLLISPVALFFALAESGWALLHRRPGQEVLSPVRAFALAFNHPRALWAARRRAQGLRRTSDFALLKTQSRGSARLRALVRPRLEKGHQLAWAASRGSAAPMSAMAAMAARPATSTVTASATTMTPSMAPAPSPAAAAAATTLPAAPTDALLPPSAGAVAVTAGAGHDLNGSYNHSYASPLSGAAGVGAAGAVSVAGGAAGLAGPAPYSTRGPAIRSRVLPGDAPVGRERAQARQNGHDNGEAASHEDAIGYRPPADWRAGALTAVIVGVLLAIGSRNYLTGPLPLVGQLPSLSGGVGSWWHDWWSGAGPGSLGASSYAPPGLFFMGLVGAVSFGSANLAIHLLVLGPLVLGPLGVYMATRVFGSRRGRVAATVVYAALPVAYNAMAQGHWAGLVAYAAAPWALSLLCRLGGQAPYPRLRWSGAWARFISLGLLVAVATSLAPATLLLVPIVGCALFVGSLLTGRGKGGARFFFASLIASGVAFLALAPWSFAAFHSFDALFELAGAPAGPLSVSSVLRLETGPYGSGVLGWAVVAAAAVPLFIGRSWRMAWAARLWAVAFTCLGLVWAGSRGWFPIPTLELVLAFAGAALAFSVAVGAAAVELDLSGYRFGWRQFAPAFGALAVVAAAVPFVSWAGGGQWGLPGSAAESAYAFPTGSQGGDYRVLWVGSPGSLPLAAQGSAAGVAFATSLDGLPSASQLWGPEQPG